MYVRACAFLCPFKACWSWQCDVKQLTLVVISGLLLSVGGFLSFMLTGSISAVRFGVILGGALVGMSVWSLKSYQKGESLALALRGQSGQL